jgi:hypothetical protein
MRDEMLKRLDELVQEAVALDVERDPGGVLLVRDEWLALRAELAAERCENCTHWRARTWPSDDCALHEVDVRGDTFCCNDFEAKKEPSP